MDQLRDYSDDRLVNGCIYCGGLEETREHVPSKVLLESPFPTNLPVMKSCFNCNNGFSQDEEYVACLIECMIVGSTRPDEILNPRISRKLHNNHSLRTRIQNSIRANDGTISFLVEEDRFVNVIRKLAVGHAAYELSRVLRDVPTLLSWRIMSDMTEEEKDSYDIAHVTNLLGEVGSINTQRLLVTHIKLQGSDGELKTLDLLINDWVVVQENKYRYHAVDKDEGVVVKIIFSEFLACEVFWEI